MPPLARPTRARYERNASDSGTARPGSGQSAGAPPRQRLACGSLPAGKMEDFLRDLRLAVRGFLRAPAFTAAAVAALALGIGGSSAIFSVLDGVVLQPLKAPHAAELVRVYETFPAGDPDSFSPANFVDLATEN